MARNTESTSGKRSVCEAVFPKSWGAGKIDRYITPCIFCPFSSGGPGSARLSSDMAPGTCRGVAEPAARVRHNSLLPVCLRLADWNH